MAFFHSSDKRQINHNKPLIATLPIMSHFDRPRMPRPKPLDLRRSVSNRNTPSTNSTESNNSPNSIVSKDQPNTPNHSQPVIVYSIWDMKYFFLQLYEIIENFSNRNYIPRYKRAHHTPAVSVPCLIQFR